MFKASEDTRRTAGSRKDKDDGSRDEHATTRINDDRKGLRIILNLVARVYGSCMCD